MKLAFRVICAILFISVLFLILNTWAGWLALPIDQTTLILMLVALGLALLPFLASVKIGGVEFAQLVQDVKKIEGRSLFGEVVEFGSSYFLIDANGKHKLPDKKTAEFLKSAKGIIPVNETEFNNYKGADDFESVLNAELVKVEEDGKGTYFVVLNGRVYYINSWSIIMNWGKSDKDFVLKSVKYIETLAVGR